ncbi:MAG: glycosyltransferase [Clostridia bacterium]|nr:glycosyltransferase [Clostridia bacterium]
MKYLWIGVGNSKEDRAHILENGGKILSAEVSNDALLAGLDSTGVICDSLNSSRIPSYPTYPEKKIAPQTWSRTGTSVDYNVGYLNYKYVNLLSKAKAMKKAAKVWAKKNRGEDVTVFVYQMHTPFMGAALAVKKVNPTAKIVLIVPDLPQYMDMHMSRLKKILKGIDWRKIRRYMKKIDRYVLYSRHMADFLKLPDGSYCVMEGSYDPTLLVEDPRPDTDTVSVMYSGVLDLRYGIRELLDAFETLDGNYELWLTGNGNAVPLIKERAEKDPRIKMLGYLPSREDLLRKQRQATMLISTRDPAEPASKYCFPSKLFEYMVSGNPVLSTRIGGIPEEYEPYLIYLEDISVDGIRDAILKVAQMPVEERMAFGDAARTFVLNEKNNIAQAQKILSFLE